ncbi:hypothetical protein POSPLADRAFT_1038711 [Postia placenta MAD-698-R-SB12]|uniref:Uncharacterized protein n=1 Tax=Postia placenta MAD-698-R-SB12 TaxID=670580 RepID=A0A1X6NDM3_9APHY|nr:hypothetical protein POSPLADRAFT_1038711 [Postia placenta MAD-698-R-SB12]OSX66731.1 hypothetical protein POSPLADRAFT_1038711 [Postia placenta MAD-698-R-SB12]
MSISRGVPGKNNTVAQLHAIAGYVRGVSVTILDSIYERVAPPTSRGGMITRSTLRPACNPRRSGCPGRRLQE